MYSRQRHLSYIYIYNQFCLVCYCGRGCCCRCCYCCRFCSGAAWRTNLLTNRVAEQVHHGAAMVNLVAMSSPEDSVKFWTDRLVALLGLPNMPTRSQVCWIRHWPVVSFVQRWLVFLDETTRDVCSCFWKEKFRFFCVGRNAIYLTIANDCCFLSDYRDNHHTHCRQRIVLISKGSCR